MEAEKCIWHLALSDVIGGGWIKYREKKKRINGN